MTPRERVLAAMRREDVDYPPCLPVFGEAPGTGGLTWTNEEERLDVLVNRLGVDAFVSLGMGPDVHPDVRERVWTEHPRDLSYPLIHKVYETPAGPLNCTVRRTEDWPHGDSFPLRSDHLSSRLVKPWVETEADMDRLEYVYLPPERSDAQLEAEFGEVKDRAERWQVPMYMLVGSGLYAAYSIFGAEQAVWLSMDEPALVERLADLEHRVTLARIEIASRIGVDMVRRSSHYETTDFCNPEQVRHYMVPRFRREIELAHQHGMAVVSAACTGVMPILDLLEELPFDCLFDFDPTLGGQDLGKAWDALGQTKSFWGGMSEATHVHMGSEKTVRRAVRDFYEICGPRGTILAAVSSFQPEDPVENIHAMIDEWRKAREDWAN